MVRARRPERPPSVERDGPSGVEVRDLVHVYKEAGPLPILAVDHVSLRVAPGEFYTLLGPSGCGKTTTLRCIAGLERPFSGEINIGGVVVSGRQFVPAHRRDVGMVFQDYAVWPHMTVFENVAFPLRIGHTPSRETAERVGKVLDLMGMSHLASRRATQLSGGQQQRLAVARALVREPSALLLDEPLSNLDSQLREQMRTELRSIQRRLKITTIFVTHDQVEALSMSDRIAVMSHGRIAQEGSPMDIYRSPSNEFVASFIGKTTFLRGVVEKIDNTAGAQYAVVASGLGRVRCLTVDQVHPGATATIAVRPESVRLSLSPAASSPNLFEGRVTLSSFLGEAMDYRVEIASENIRAAGDTRNIFKRGDRVFVQLPPEECILLPSADSPS